MVPTAVGKARAVIAALQNALPHQRLGHGVLQRIRRTGQSRIAEAHQLGTTGASVGLIGAAAGMARFAHVAAHGSHGHEQLGHVIGRRAAGKGVVVHEHDRVVLADSLGEPANILRRGTAQGAGPLGRLRGAIVVAHQIAAEALLRSGIAGHMVLVEPDAALVEEVVVHHIGGNHLVAYAQHEGRIGPGKHRHPPGLEVRCRGIVGGAHVHELHTGVLRLVEVVHGGAARRPSRVAAHDHNGLGVLVIIAIVQKAQVRGGQSQSANVESIGADRAGVGKRHMTAQLMKNLAHGEGLRADNCRGSVSAVDALGLLGDIVDGLIPGDLLPLVLAAQLAMGVLAAAGLPVLALHGVLHAVLAEHLLGAGATTGTAALLQPAEAVLMGRLAALTDNLAVAHQHAIHAAASTVVPAGRGNPRSLIDRGLLPCFGQGVARRLRRAGRQRRQRARCQRTDRASLQKAAARQAGLDGHHARFAHGIPLLLNPSGGKPSLRLPAFHIPHYKKQQIRQQDTTTVTPLVFE